jgi:hypothetical protein
MHAPRCWSAGKAEPLALLEKAYINALVTGHPVRSHLPSRTSQPSRNSVRSPGIRVGVLGGGDAAPLAGPIRRETGGTPPLRFGTTARRLSEGVRNGRLPAFQRHESLASKPLERASM